MFSVESITRAGFPRIIRYLGNNAIKYDKRSLINEVPKAEFRTSSIRNSQPPPGLGLYKCSKFDKFILVWTKKYPSIAECPDAVSYNVLTTSRSKARVKTCLYMIAFATVGYIVTITQGRMDLNKHEQKLAEQTKELKKAIMSK